MKICPTCRHCYEDADAVCARDAAHAPLAPARPGTRLVADRYRLDRLLGRGGMGAVYAGTHVELERPAAIKLLLPDLVSDAQALERFRREARAAARLNHPNVADTYDYGILPGGEAYIVMELVEGQTLREYINASGALDAGEAVAIARQVADGIEVAHRNGIVHRDLKPSNIILSRDHHEALQAKVVDFGIAKLKEYSASGGVLTNTGSLIGTPRYMSPEQCAGHDIDARSDIYSLGVILFELLAGRPPFDAPSATAIALKHVQDAPPRLQDLRPDVPAALCSLVMRALDKEPDARPQTAAELARALRPFEPPLRHTHPHGHETRTAASDDSAQRDSHTSPSLVHTGMSRDTQTAPPPDKELPDTSRAGSPTLEESDGRHDHDSASSSEAGLSSPVAHDEPASQTFIPDATRRAPRTFTPLLVAAALAGLVGLAAWFFVSRSGDEEVARDRNAPAADSRNNSSAAPDTSPADAANARTNQAASATRATPTPAPSDDTAAGTAEAERRALNSALASWVAATNARDLDRHMTFYMPRLDTYYLSNGVAAAAVRRDKAAVITQARSVRIDTDPPAITFARDGRTAVMEFRKQYAIDGGSINSTGEVVQELIWRKTDDGWRIISERDKRVIR